MPDFLSRQEGGLSPKEGSQERDSLEIIELKRRIIELESKTATPERIMSTAEKTEEIKREIKDYLQTAQQTPSFAVPISTRDELKEVKRMEPSQQIGALVSLVFEKDLKTALEVAEDINNPAILDEFHDTLIDHYYQDLIKKGVLKEM